MQLLKGRPSRKIIGIRYFFADALVWGLAIIVSLGLRLDFNYSSISLLSAVILFFIAIALQFIFGQVVSLYNGRYPSGGFDEVRALVFTAILTSIVIGGATFLLPEHLDLPRSTGAFTAVLALFLQAAIRYIKRLYREQKNRGKNIETAEKVLIFGGGSLGEILIKQLLSEPVPVYYPIGIIDDSDLKQRLELWGVPVLGKVEDIPTVAMETEATTLIISIARADTVLINRVTKYAEQAGLKILVLPTINEVLEGRVKQGDLREIAIEDYIGREQVEIDVSNIASYINGYRVLVTGAGGSIGKELAQQVYRFGPSELTLLDRDETGLQTTQLAVFGNGLLNSDEIVLADIRDRESLEKIFADRRPQVVFHAAALKHLPMLEHFPTEAWKTNVLGTLNVLEVAKNTGVTTFVNVSTDKAASPTNVLGHSKRITERLTAWFAKSTGQRYISVRFGNVLGSRGSLIPTFISLITNNKPLTVTHPDATRYFMSIPEASRLVVQAGGIGRPGEVLILDMGEPVRIQDIAERMLRISGKQLPIVYTGLREGEKLHEILVAEDEGDERPFHPLLTHAKVKPLSPNSLDYGEFIKRAEDSKLKASEAAQETTT